jgi:uncharacterized membrane protein
MSSPIRYPIQGAIVAVGGLAMIFLGIILPVTKTPQENPITGLVIPGFFVVFAAIPVTLGVHADFCCGSDDSELYEREQYAGKQVGPKRVGPNQVAQCAVRVVAASGTVFGVGAAGQMLELNGDELR